MQHRAFSEPFICVIYQGLQAWAQESEGWTSQGAPEASRSVDPPRYGGAEEH